MVAGLNLPLTFQRTLMPRALADQAIITGLNSVLVSTLASGLQEGRGHGCVHRARV